MIIGLTGGSGCGKSCGARVFSQAGFVVLDFDKIARDVCSAGSECLEEIKIHFGNEIILPDGSLNRQALGAIVFADEKLLSILTKITHKYILKETDALIKEHKGKNLLFDAPLLFEAGLDQKCDYVVSILASKELRLARICERDGLDKAHALARIQSQPDDDFYLEKSDLCLFNNDDLPSLEQKLREFLKQLLKEYHR